jgi:hypothetical protein
MVSGTQNFKHILLFLILHTQNVPDNTLLLGVCSYWCSLLCRQARSYDGDPLSKPCHLLSAIVED